MASRKKKKSGARKTSISGCQEWHRAARYLHCGCPTRVPKPEKVRLLGEHDVAVVKLRAFTILDNAVSAGASSGVRRAFKHMDAPSPDSIADEVSRSVMDALCEVLDMQIGDG